jgi:hypothetical protein
MRHLGTAVLLVFFLIPSAHAQLTSDAVHKLELERLRARAKTGRCAKVPTSCPVAAGYGIAYFPVLTEECTFDRAGCQRAPIYHCGGGYVPLSKAKDGRPYYAAADVSASLARSAEVQANPDSPAGERYRYCQRARSLVSELDGDLRVLKDLSERAGALSMIGGMSYMDLIKKVRGLSALAEMKLAQFLVAERAGQAAPALRELDEIKRELDGIRAKRGETTKAVVRSAEKVEALARKAQTVLIKAAGGAVYLFTGGNRIAQCLTEAGIETAVNTVGENISNGKELTLGGIGKKALTAVIFRCADALTGGAGGQILSAITEGLGGYLKDLQEKVKQKLRGFWAGIREKLQPIIDKLRFLLDEELYRVLSGAAEDVAVEFGSAAMGCLPKLVQRDFAGLFRCLGQAAKSALAVGLPRGAFDAALELLAKNVPAAKDKLRELAAKVDLGSAKPAVSAFIEGLGAGAAATIESARECRTQITGFNAQSIRGVFQCLKERLKTVGVAAAREAFVEELKGALSSEPAEARAEFGRVKRAVAAGLSALGLELPPELVQILEGAAEGAVASLLREARSCVELLRAKGELRARLRNALTCLKTKARSVLPKKGAPRAPELEAFVSSVRDLASSAEKGSLDGATRAADAINARLERLRAGASLSRSAIREAIRRGRAPFAVAARGCGERLQDLGRPALRELASCLEAAAKR